MGSAKAQLVYQFLTESLIISLVATAFAVIIAELTLPSFNGLAHKNLTLQFNPLIIGGLLLTAVVVGVLAGSYPAFILSAFNPVVVMKGNFTSNAKGTWLRNGLVVFQFFISIVLIVGTLVVSDQMRFMQNKELGYNKSSLLKDHSSSATARRLLKMKLKRSRVWSRQPAHHRNSVTRATC